MENDKQVATINHAFEPPKPPFEDEGQTFLDLMNPQSALSDDLLDMFKEMVANDEVYRQRLERHYKMWKSVVDDPSHPDHHKVRSEFHDDPDFEPAFPRQETVRRDEQAVFASYLLPACFLLGLGPTSRAGQLTAHSLGSVLPPQDCVNRSCQSVKLDTKHSLIIRVGSCGDIPDHTKTILQDMLDGNPLRNSGVRPAIL